MSFYPHYKEATYLVKVVRRTDTDGDRYVPDLPDLQFGLVLCFCDGVNYFSSPLPDSTEGKDCICYVVYKVEDSIVMDKIAGNLGQGNDVCKIAEYKTVITKTVSDVEIVKEQERMIAEVAIKGEVVNQTDLNAVKYDLKDYPDANDGIPAWVFQTKEYVDK